MLALVVHVLDNAFSVICIFSYNKDFLQHDQSSLKFCIYTDYEEYINYNESQPTIQCHLNISKTWFVSKHTVEVCLSVGGMLGKPSEHWVLYVPWIYGLIRHFSLFYGHNPLIHRSDKLTKSSGLVLCWLTELEISTMII